MKKSAIVVFALGRSEYNYQADYRMRYVQYLTFNVKTNVLTFKSVKKILWCDHSNETSLALFFHGLICFSILFTKSNNFRIFISFDELLIALLGAKELD